MCLSLSLILSLSHTHKHAHTHTPSVFFPSATRHAAGRKPFYAHSITRSPIPRFCCLLPSLSMNYFLQKAIRSAEAEWQSAQQVSRGAKKQPRRKIVSIDFGQPPAWSGPRAAPCPTQKTRARGEIRLLSRTRSSGCEEAAEKQK